MRRTLFLGLLILSTGCGSKNKPAESKQTPPSPIVTISPEQVERERIANEKIAAMQKQIDELTAQKKEAELKNQYANTQPVKPPNPPADAIVTKTPTAENDTPSNGSMVGPRGGVYHLSKNGNKVYERHKK